MNKKFTKLLQNLLLLFDIAALNISLLLILSLTSDRVSNNSFNYYYYYLVIVNMIWMTLTWSINLYQESNLRSFETLTKKTIKIYLAWLCVALLYLYFSRDVYLSRYFTFLTSALFFFLLIGNRFLYSFIQYLLKVNNHLIHRVIILGYNDTAKKIADYLQERSVNTQIMGFSENFHNIKELSPYPIVSQIGETIEVSKKLNVNEVLSTITPKQNKEVFNLMRQAEKECIHFRFIPDFFYLFQKKTYIEYFNDLPVFSIRKEPLEDIGNRIQKRLLDISISVLVIIFVLSWMVPLIGLLIYLESPGPIFFSQLRTGKNNTTFHCFKFRSMHVNEYSDLKQATKNDSRITRIGRFLRKSSLDEFPQFINVFLGHMSLVGPRPHMTKHTEDYSKIVSSYMVRQFLKPGITGWAQVNGYRGEIKDQESITKRVEHDLWYLENWSIWLDLKIIFLTACNIFKGEKNAY